MQRHTADAAAAATTVPPNTRTTEHCFTAAAAAAAVQPTSPLDVRAPVSQAMRSLSTNPMDPCYTARSTTLHVLRRTSPPSTLLQMLAALMLLAMELALQRPPELLLRPELKL
jgi:CMP-N-acetylneuraminic acid synthetase